MKRRNRSHQYRRWPSTDERVLVKRALVIRTRNKIRSQIPPGVAWRWIRMRLADRFLRPKRRRKGLVMTRKKPPTRPPTVGREAVNCVGSGVCSSPRVAHPFWIL